MTNGFDYGSETELKKFETKNFQIEYGKVKEVENLSPEKNGYFVIIYENKIEIIPTKYSKEGALHLFYTLKKKQGKIVYVDEYNKRERDIFKDYAGFSYIKYFNNNEKYGNKKVPTSELFIEIQKIYREGGELR